MKKSISALVLSAVFSLSALGCTETAGYTQPDYVFNEVQGEYHECDFDKSGEFDPGEEQVCLTESEACLLMEAECETDSECEEAYEACMSERGW